MKKVNVLGHIAYDYIFDIPYHPKEGYSIYIEKFSRHYGGGGANICYGIKKLGGNCKLISCIGKDAKRYEEYLIKNDIELHLYRSNKKLARAYIFNSKDKQTTYFYWGASEDMEKIRVIKSNYLHIAPSHPKAAIKMAEKAKFFAFEPGQDLPRYKKEDISYLIDGADIIFCNEFEIKKLKKFNLKGKEVIVTLGKKGCMRYKNKKIIPAISSKAIDVTGAGDAFKAAFWIGFLKGYDIEKCCKIANIASSFVIRKRGAQNMPSFEVIERWSKKYK